MSDRTKRALALLDAVERLDRSSLKYLSIAGMEGPQMDGTLITRAASLHGLLLKLAETLPKEEP